MTKTTLFAILLASCAALTMAGTPDSFSVDQVGNVVGSSFTGDVDWSNLVNAPLGFADGVDDGLDFDNLIVVAAAGGDYTSVADALDATADAGAANRYLVLVAPGIYQESFTCLVRGYVHLKGFGPDSEIRSSLTSGTPSAAAATVEIADGGRISDLKVVNTGTGTYGIALYSSMTSRDTVVDNVVAEATGAGGTGHYAAYWNDAEATIRNSTLFAGGATGFGTAVNAGFGSVNVSAGFPQALIENSTIIGGTANSAENCIDPSGTGFGMQLSNSSPLVRGSYICGGHRGIALVTNGHAQIQSSSVKVSSAGSAFLFEITASGSIKLANSGVGYLGNKFTGAGTGLSCVHTYNLGTYAALSDAINSSAGACN